MSLPEKLGALPALLLQLAAFGLLALYLWKKRGPRTDTRWKGRAVYIGAIVMAVFAVLNLLVAGQPWGVVYGLGLWGAKVVSWLGVDLTANAFWGREAQQAHIHSSLLTDVTSITNLGLLVGALLAANVRGTACPAHARESEAVDRGGRGRPAARLLVAARVRLQRRRLLLRHLDRQRARLGVVRDGVRRLDARRARARATGAEGMSAAGVR